MTVGYWIVAALLAVFYAYSGSIKIVRSRERLLPMMGWVATTPMPLVRTIGVLEVLGAVGLIVPPLLGLAPATAVLAAAGLTVLQAAAIVVHVRRGDGNVVWLNIALLVAGIVATWLATVWI